MDDVILEAKQMDGRPEGEQAAQAINYALRRIKEEPHIAWRMGAGTQAWALLTEAYSTLSGKPIIEVRKAFMPTGRDPGPLLEAAQDAANCLLDSPEGTYRKKIGERLQTEIGNFKR
jgi:hypothetical protein